MSTCKHYVGDKLSVVLHQVTGPTWWWGGGRLLPVRGWSHLLQSPGSKQGTVWGLVHQAQQRKDEPYSSSVTTEKPRLLPSWYSKLEADVKGGFFSLTFSQVIPLLTQWEWKTLQRSLLHMFCLVKPPAEANLLKPMPPAPTNRHLWSRLWRDSNQSPPPSGPRGSSTLAVHCEPEF